jgi:hypothetical protein
VLEGLVAVIVGAIAGSVSLVGFKVTPKKFLAFLRSVGRAVQGKACGG